MNKNLYNIIFGLVLLMVLAITSVFGQENTVGVTYNNGESYDAYTLFSPSGDSIAYLIDNDGRIIKKWISNYRPGNAVYLMEDGSLYRAGKVLNDSINAGGAGGVIEKFDWDGNLVWTYINANDTTRAHHDFQVLPNGNVLVLIWEQISGEEVLAKGRNPELLADNKLWPEMIAEIEPTGIEGGNTVWEWHAWDHLVQDFDDTKESYGIVAEHKGKIDLNYIWSFDSGADWHHANSINYNPQLDQIMISVRNFDEVWVINHNITTDEARGEKGDLIFRWGNPLTYKSGTVADKQLFGQHNAHWIPASLPDEGKMMIFNNGSGRPDGLFSSIVKINPTITPDGSYEISEEKTFLPVTYEYEYTAANPTDFFSKNISGAQQLPNGNLLIDDGPQGTFFEINQNNEIVWQYINPVTRTGVLEQGQIPSANSVFRALKYGKNFAAFEGITLTPGSFIENYVLSVDSKLLTRVQMYPNPSYGHVVILSSSKNNHVQLWDMSGQLVLEHSCINDRIELEVGDIPVGLYQVILNSKPVGRLHLKN